MQTNLFSIKGKLLPFYTAILLLSLSLVLPVGKALGCGNYNTAYITTNTTWTSAQDTFGGASILISDGVTLTLDGCNLTFHQYSVIANRDTPTSAAHLIIKNGTTLRACSGAFFWQGIVMTGVDDGAGRYTEYNSALTGINMSQTSVQVFGSCVIENAYIGIQALKHAILQIDGAQFTNCRTGVYVHTIVPDYHFASILTSHSAVTCASYIQSAMFNISIAVNYMDPSLYKYTCVKLDGTEYFWMMGNTFECTSTPADSAFGRPTGIEAINANFSCHSTSGILNPESGCISYSGTKVRNRFLYLTYGIHSVADSISNTIHLDDCRFKDCFVAAYVKGGQHDVFNADSFGLKTSGSSYWDINASSKYNNFVWLDHVSNFIFYRNMLKEDKKYTTFLYVDGSGTDQKNITQDTFINTISGSFSAADREYGLRFSRENRGQIVTCNNFNKHLYGIYIDSTATLSPFVLKSPITNDGVGNSFSSMSSSGVDIFYNDTVSPTSGLNYFSHSLVTHNPFVIQIRPLLDSCVTIANCTAWPLAIKGYDAMWFPMKVYPNPAGNRLIFDLSDLPMMAMRSKLTITNMLGQVVKDYKCTEFDPLIEINTSQYAPGVYVYRMILNEDMEKTGKFEIRH